MFGYVVPSYRRLSPADLKLYRRYYCEGCHNLKMEYGLMGTTIVNYDMTFNTILIDGALGEALNFRGTESSICFLDSPKSNSEMMKKIAAYTVILTKWELFDDEVDKPSIKTNLIALILNRSIRKSIEMYPQYDKIVGDGFKKLRDLELSGCKDIYFMGHEFGSRIVEVVYDITSGRLSIDLRNMLEELSTIVYILDAIDDLDEDFINNTYNPLLPKYGYTNAHDYIIKNLYSIIPIVNETIGSLQKYYSSVRKKMYGNVSLCDNVVYYGIPESAGRIITNMTSNKNTISNMLLHHTNRKIQQC